MYNAKERMNNIVYRYDLDGRVEILLIMDVDSRGDIYKRR